MAATITQEHVSLRHRPGRESACAHPLPLSFSFQALVVLARQSERASCRRVKGVQRIIEGQLKDHTVFPPGNTVSFETASRSVLLSSASGGKHIKAVCKRAWKSFHLKTRRLGGCQQRPHEPMPVGHLAA